MSNPLLTSMSNTMSTVSASNTASNTTSQPMDITGSHSASIQAQGADNGPPSPAIAGTPDLRALRAQYGGTPPVPNIPPRSVTGTPRLEGSLPKPSASPLSTRELPAAARGSSGSPLLRPSSASISGISASRPGTSDTVPDNLNLDDLPDEEKAKILRRHLVSREEREREREDRASLRAASSENGNGNVKGKERESSEDQDGRSSPRSSAGLHLTREDTEPFPVPYHAPGADVTHDIYKWQSQRRSTAQRPRSASYAGVSAPPPHPAFEHIHEPGGFRRNYVLLKADNEGTERPRILRSFIDFLYIFGHFAGEDLEDDEDMEDEDVVVPTDPPAPFYSGPSIDQQLESGGFLSVLPESERTPLLDAHRKSKSVSAHRRSRSRRRPSVGPHGDATVTEAVLMLLKSFVGTGVLFLGKAFFNGGILFSALLLCFIALISLYSFLLLVKTKFIVPGSFGDIGGELYGPWFRYCILTSITVSQMGFVAAYIIFVSENLQAFVLAVTECAKLIPVPYFIVIQALIFLPLVLIRNIAKLSTTALVADVFILAGLIYIFGSELSIISRRGIADVQLFNPKDFPLVVGTAVFSFEGIGLVIPITDAMKEPRKFPAVLAGVMIFLMVLFCGGGVLAYATFGSEIQTLVLTNLDTSSRVLQTVQFLYSTAILLSVPLQLFPAIRIMENGLFTQSGKGDAKVKWLKNIFRFFIVGCCALISYLGASDLDKFVSFVGSFACVPLCYVYPPMLHYKIARSRKQRIADIALMIFGSAAALYTTIQTIRLMATPGSSGPPKLGECAIPGSGN